MLTATDRYYVQIGSQYCALEADTESHAIIEALARIGDPDTWPGCMIWNHRRYHNGERDEVILIYVKL